VEEEQQPCEAKNQTAMLDTSVFVVGNRFAAFGRNQKPELKQLQQHPERAISKRSFLVFQCCAKEVLRLRLLGFAAPAEGD